MVMWRFLDHLKNRKKLYLNLAEVQKWNFALEKTTGFELDLV